MPITNQKPPESDYYRETYDGIYRKLHEIVKHGEATKWNQTVTIIGSRLIFEGYLRNNERPGQPNIRYWSVVAGVSSCPFYTFEVDHISFVIDTWFIYMEGGLL